MNVLITGEVWLYTLMLVALPMVATAIYFVDTDPIQVIVYFGFIEIWKLAIIWLTGLTALLQVSLKASIKNFNVTGTNDITLNWNNVQNKFTCCGVDGFEDWVNLSNGSFPTDKGYKVPQACCEAILPDSTGINI